MSRLILNPYRFGVFTTWGDTSVSAGATATLSGSNLVLTNTGSGGTAHVRSVAQLAGKQCWAVYFTTLPGSGFGAAGVIDASVAMPTANAAGPANTWVLRDTGDYKANAGADTASGTGAFSAGQYARFAVDMATNKAWVGDETGWIGDPGAGTGETFSGLPATLYPYGNVFFSGSSGVITANFGLGGLPFTAPTGFSAGVF